MSAMTLPAMAARATNIVRDTLAEPSAEQSARESEALVKTCELIAALFDSFLLSINDNLAQGVDSRTLLARLNEGIQAGAFALEQCLALRRHLDEFAGLPRPPINTLQKATAAIERVRGELLSMAEWVKASPPPPDLAKLKEASKGPFVPLRGAEGNGCAALPSCHGVPVPARP